MFELDNIKFILWDFDETLAIHGRHQTADEKWAKLIMQTGAEAWNIMDVKPNMQIKRLMEMASDMGIRQGLISATNSKFAQEKISWVKQQYGIELENFCCCGADFKCKWMEDIACAYGYERKEIMIVDDYYSVITSCADAGFTAASPMEIVNFVNNFTED